MINEFDAVIFDFDGVIVDTEWAVYQTWHEFYSENGVDLPLEIYFQCVGGDHNAWDPKAYLEELLGKKLDWDAILPERNLATRALLENEGVMPGVIRLLNAADAAGLPISVASSSHRVWVEGWLEKLGLRERFKTTSCRDDVPRVKPAPDLFLDAAQKLGVDPAKCLVIEDSFNGMSAAMTAGMKVIAVPNRITAGQNFEKAWQRVNSLDNVDLPTVFGGRV